MYLIASRKVFSLASFSFVLLIPFINEPESPRDLIIFVISSISSLQIINVVHFAKSEERIHGPKMFF